MNIELADAVTAIREELLDAARRGTDQEISFTVGPIEMEFVVELRADAKAKLGFKAWVLGSAELEGSVGGGRNHRVMVTLTPKRPDGGDLLIAATAQSVAEPADVAGHIGR